jgi:hypothetical protein
MKVRRARAALSFFWLLSIGPLFLAVIAQTILGKYGDEWDVPWSWLSPLTFPILALIIASWSVKGTLADEKEVTGIVAFWGTLVLSFFYVATLYLIMILEPISDLGWTKIMKWSGWYLGPIQGFVVGALGKFFIESIE